VKTLFHLHPDYTGGLAGKLQNEAGPPPGDWLPVQDWLQHVHRLYDPAKTKDLDTRLTIWGLAALDSALRDYLTSFGMLDALKPELEKDNNGAFPEQLLRHPGDATAGSPGQEQRRVDGTQPEVAQAQAETWQDAVLLAETLATTAPTPRPADSVLLLAALSILRRSTKILCETPPPGVPTCCRPWCRPRDLMRRSIRNNRL
jgi:hypothetical protein